MLKSRVSKSYGKLEVVISEAEVPEAEARIAQEFMIKWGCVAAEPDGEDSAGRQQLKVMTEERLVERSFKAAKLFMEHARKNNLFHVCVELPEDEEEEEINLHN